MKLVRLGRAKWDVLATLSDGEDCEVLDFLLGKREGQQGTRKGMYSFLRETVPRYGPQEENTELCLRMRPYEDGLYEFRKQPRTGPKVRVVFFTDGNRIICVNGFLKTDMTPQRKLDEAAAIRRLYFDEKRKGEVEILDL
jgi:hypothetical protein